MGIAGEVFTAGSVHSNRPPPFTVIFKTHTTARFPGSLIAARVGHVKMPR